MYSFYSASFRLFINYNTFVMYSFYSASFRLFINYNTFVTNTHIERWDFCGGLYYGGVLPLYYGADGGSVAGTRTGATSTDAVHHGESTHHHM